MKKVEKRPSGYGGRGGGGDKRERDTDFVKLHLYA